MTKKSIKIKLFNVKTSKCLSSSVVDYQKHLQLIIISYTLLGLFSFVWRPLPLCFVRWRQPSCVVREVFPQWQIHPGSYTGQVSGTVCVTVKRDAELPHFSPADGSRTPSALSKQNAHEDILNYFVLFFFVVCNRLYFCRLCSTLKLWDYSKGKVSLIQLVLHTELNFFVVCYWKLTGLIIDF